MRPRWWAIGGMAVAAGAAFGNRLLIGHVYGEAKAVQLIEAIASSALYFGAAVATSSTTILALMLTLLAFAHRVDTEFDHEVYRAINRICLLSTAGLCGAILLLLILSFPVGEFDELPAEWFPILYEVLVILVAFLAGLLIGTVLLLLMTIRRVIAQITPTDEV